MEGDSFDSQTTACDIPTDGRLFINISIPKAELVTDYKSPHVVYTVQVPNNTLFFRFASSNGG